ncbi:two pore domain potassium channel family protein [Hymenobacter terricola]|uniref:two pore domain potassium channel family protein n=1 Tax=Hymenobacter terricola TaxID=2819236 RepID=UPI001B30780D|nr:two pore domain potassium channel family protein [Hymenobacter terricola]
MRSPIVKATGLFVGCIFITLLLFHFACRELNNSRVEAGLLVLLTVVKATYFLLATLGWIHLTVTSGHHRKYMMVFLVLQMLLIVFSFAIDYYCLYQLDPSSFRVTALSHRPIEQFLTFLYFSVGKYTTAGVGDIHPVSPIARICAMGEMVVAYFTTVMIIANVGYLQMWFSQKFDNET